MRAYRAITVIVLLSQLAGSALAGDGDASPRALLAGLRFPADQPQAYVERQRSPMFKRAVDSRGRVWRTSQGALYMQVQVPRQELRCIEAQSLTILRPEVTAAVDTMLPASAFTRVRHQLKLAPQRPGHLLLLTASALLNGKVDWVTQQFELAFATETKAGAGPAQQIVLTPKDPKSREGMPGIRLSVVGDQLREVEADRGRRGSITLSFLPLPP